MRVLVAVPVPALDLLSYAVPDGIDAPPVGARVIVPLGSRLVTGIVVERSATDELRDVKPIHQIVDADSFVPPDVVALARWTAEYYACGVGDTIPALLPPMARGGRADAHKTMRVAAITTAGLEAVAVAAGSDAVSVAGPDAASVARPFQGRELTTKQREALVLLAGSPDGIPTPVLATRGIAADAMSRLARHGYVSFRQERIDRDPWGPTRVGPGSDPCPSRVGPPLMPEQEAAFRRLSALARVADFRVALLHGVTGSGKTEIYLRLAAAVRDAGRRTLMLVPEIALTPAVAALFRDTFGERVAIQHSGLSDGERHDQWQRIRRGDIDVVVGTRSAVFAPLAPVGLIVVDEEHDGSYKQEETPRYNGRDVAMVRAQAAGACVVLGSATPSLESRYNAERGKYTLLELPGRIEARPMPTIGLVDMRQEFLETRKQATFSRK